jgi:short-subunit dehydrogenase
MSDTNDFLERYGPWAIVTGASSGIGEQFARLLAEQGFYLIIIARREERLDKLAEDLQEHHAVEVLPLALDLSSQNFLTDLTSAIADKDIGLLISNAGFGLKGEHHQTSAGKMDQMLQLNSRAPMLLAHALSPALINRGKGAMVFTGSIEGFLAFPWSASYAASKAFLLSLGESLWYELQPYGVDVLVLAPGSTNTEALPLQGFDPKQQFGLMSPRQVAKQALSQIGKRPVFISGWMNRLFIRILCALPRNIATSLAGAGMRSAIKKSQSKGK